MHRSPDARWPVVLPSSFASLRGSYSPLAVAVTVAVSDDRWKEAVLMAPGNPSSGCGGAKPDSVLLASTKTKR